MYVGPEPGLCGFRGHWLICCYSGKLSNEEQTGEGVKEGGGKFHTLLPSYPSFWPPKSKTSFRHTLRNCMTSRSAAADGEAFIKEPGIVSRAFRTKYRRRKILRRAGQE